MSPAIPLEVRHPRQPRLSRWGDIFLRHGGGDVVQSMYDDDFYTWWERQVPALEQFPYAGMDFRGDPDLVLPPGGAWGELGNFYFQNFKIFMNFKYKYIYICLRVLILLKCQNTDIGLVRPEGHPHMYVCPILGEDQGLIRVLEGKMSRLTQRVPTLWIEHIPTIMQEFVVGVPHVWICLLR